MVIILSSCKSSLPRSKIINFGCQTNNDLAALNFSLFHHYLLPTTAQIQTKQRHSGKSIVFGVGTQKLLYTSFVARNHFILIHITPGAVIFNQA